MSADIGSGARGITAVPGIRVGHATDADAATGCTVILGPFRGACQVRGLASGTRELDSLQPLHVVPRADAVLLTGGSAFGLAAADGVMAWIEERGGGFQVGAVRVPIVPAAVIFDLGVGRSDRRPDPAMGRAACDAASDGPVGQGPVGAGTGATVGKVVGPGGAMPGGVGSWAELGAGFTLGALAVVNAVGDVRDADGRILAGARSPEGRFLDATRLLADGALSGDFRRVPSPPGSNTTLILLATDAPLGRRDLTILAHAGATAMARYITPVQTPFDGDVVFAVSTSAEERATPPDQLLALGELAARAMGRAIGRAVGAP
jgi:L-aminopeptidase/D-esterase-like protein